MSPSPRCAIVGGGQAAAQCAFALRQEDWPGEIAIYSEECHPPYHRPPLSKGYLHGTVAPEDLALRPLEAYRGHAIELRLGAAVVEIDRKAQTLRLSDGAEQRYTHLVLATGSTNRRPDLPGLDAPGVHFLRSRADADALRRATRSARRVVLIGGGYVGLELAASLRSAGLAVTLLHRSPRVLSKAASPEVAALLEAIHREEGVDLRTSARVEGLAPGPRGPAVRLAGERDVEADLVVVGVGAAPNTALAERAGLLVDDGILVDERNRTCDPAIHAIGDCSRQHHPLYDRSVRLESVQNANDQARTAAASLADRPCPRRPVPWFWSDQYDVKLQIAGLAQGATATIVRATPGARRRLSVWHLKDRRLLAVEAINDPAAYAVGGRLIARRAEVDPDELADPNLNPRQLLERAKECDHA